MVTYIGALFSSLGIFLLYYITFDEECIYLNPFSKQYEPQFFNIGYNKLPLSIRP